ncbi:GNAT family N-acetyltransferase [Rossellomorea aquimaris]|uniref:GNAT family N-acetyltransferase n=1 Tax=Rossellomorea aquimaris TaxID=189382 RepID=UPI001CD68FE9|nr:GNAT family N-acetyltransferase [Rossellomorea aquimaris]MCA1056814.1 GNAT family N-acetyltransferase [Rossellomorea aquimaris]
MIRILTRADDEKCQQLIQQEPAENLFIIGDIEAFGYEQDFQRIWGDFDEQGNLRGILLKYRENFIPYSQGEFDAEGFASIINECKDFSIMSGLKAVTSKVEPFLTKKHKSKRQMYYAKLDHQKSLSDEKLDHVMEATVNELPRLVNLLNSIPEFSGGSFTVEKRRHGIEKGVARSYFIEEDGQYISSASTTAENSMSAMIVAVCTHPDHKKKGYATQCMTKLCRDVLEEGKELCLFYDNPEAGRIYKQIGFEDIGYWMMYKF